MVGRRSAFLLDLVLIVGELFGWLVLGRVYDTMRFEGMIMVFLEVKDH